MEKTNQKQNSGDNSKNIQIAGDNVVYYGLSYSDVKEIFFDLYKANALELAQEAKEKALQRAEELVSDFLRKAENEVKDTSVFAEPSFQHAIYKAQLEYSKIGDTDFKENMIEVLLERANENKRTRKQIILDEVIDILPHLTSEDLNYMSFLLLLLNSTGVNFSSLPMFHDFINNKILHFYSKTKLSHGNIEYLKYKNIVSSIVFNHYDLVEELFVKRFTGLFSKGFTVNEFESKLKCSIKDYDFLLTLCLHDTEKIQIKCMNEAIISDQLIQNFKSDKEKEVIDLFRQSTMTSSEVFEYLSGINVKFNELMIEWKKNGSLLSTHELTNVGRVIACIHIKNVLKVNLNMDIFI